MPQEQAEAAGITITQLTAIGTPVVTALVSAIVYLFRMVTSRLTSTENKLEHCEAQHQAASVKLANLEGKVETMTSVKSVVGELIEALDQRNQQSGGDNE